MAKSNIRAGAVIRDALLQNEALTAIVGQQIMPLRAAKGTTGSYILYGRDGYEPTLTQMGKVDNVAEVLVNCYSTDYDKTLDMAEAVEDTVRVMRNSGVEIFIADCVEDVAAEFKDTGEAVYVQAFTLTFGTLQK